jgi:hypothetical protein
VSRGTVQGGPLLYRHHRPAFANRTPAGIFIGPVRVEPARAEAGYEPGPTALETASVVVVRDESDLDRALELAGL